RCAEPAAYESASAAAAYLGAYGPRAILKYQEALFALICGRGYVNTITTIVDFGAGPCPGFGAIADLWSILAECVNRDVQVHYIVVDRAPSMREVGKEFCDSIISEQSDTTYTILSPGEFENITADMLIMSNVMNEGEGVYSCVDFIMPVIAALNGLQDIILI